MRGLLLGGLVLVAMDVLLSAPAARVSTIFQRPSHWLAAWMSPAVPLIPAGHLAGASTAAAGSKGGGPGIAGDALAVIRGFSQFPVT